MRSGGLAPTVLNAANEVAVAAFLAGQIPFLAIPRVVGQTLAAVVCFKFQQQAKSTTWFD